LGARFSLAAAVMLAVVAVMDVRSVWALMLPICVFSLGHGIHQPCGQAGAVSAFPHSAGLASALAGFILALVAFAVGLWLGRVLDDSVRPLAIGVSVGCALSALVAWTLVRQHGELARVVPPATVAPEVA
jgi:DHA1 family bicyclomycin/chloramphenicol resistance-like MFS transporter